MTTGNAPPPLGAVARPNAGAPNAPVDLLSIAAALLRRWKLIVACPLVVLVLTWAVLKLVPPLYKSTAEILVFDPQQQLDYSVQKQVSPFVDAVDNVAMDTEVAVIKSNALALRVAKELRLDGDPEFQPHSRLAFLDRIGWFGGKQRIPGNPEEQRAQRLDWGADALLGQLTAERVIFTYIISVSVSSEDPVKAQRLAAAVANDYLASQREARLEALERVTDWLGGRMRDLQSRVLETGVVIEKLRSEHGIADDGLGKVADQQISDLNAQLMTVRGEVAAQRARLDQARRVIETNGDVQQIPELMASSVITQLRQQQEVLSWRLSQLRSRLGDNHAEVIAARAQLAGVDKQIAEEAGHIIDGIQNSYDINLAREHSLEEGLQKLTGGKSDSPVYRKLHELQRLADADQKLYDNYYSQYTEISQRRTLQDVSARIINPATVPDAPYSPRRMLFYTLAVVFGFGGGLVMAFVIEYLQSGIRTGEQVEQSLGYRVVGMIPLVQQKSDRFGRDRLLQAVVDAPLSQLSEAVRAMRIGLEVSNRNGVPKVILLTSSLPAEGKSTAAMLLAASSATSGRKTVLIDCDLRQQTISRLFDKNAPGLSELLRGDAEPAEVIRNDKASGTDVISAGSLVRHPADLLMSRRMHELIARLREEYDYVVLDASPLLPVVDALALATMVDKILIVVEWSRTPQASVIEAFKVLRPEAGRIAGVVLNKVDLRQVYGYGYRGGYHYRSLDKNVAAVGPDR